MTLFTFYIIRIFLLSALSAAISFFLAPILIRFLKKFQFWKKEAREKTITGEKAEVFHSLHKEREVSVPRSGGVLIWISVAIVIFLFFGISFLPRPWWMENFNFLSRAETWLPLFTLVVGSIVGLLDDVLTVRPIGISSRLSKIFSWLYGKKEYIGGGMGFKRRLLIVVLIGLIGGWWFIKKAHS